MTDLEKEILGKIIKIENSNKDRLYKETNSSKNSVKKEILDIIKNYSKLYFEEEIN